MNRTGRTIGAAIGAVIFMLFMADVAGRMVYASTPDTATTYTVTVRP